MNGGSLGGLNSAVAMEQKQALRCLKHKSLNINLLFIELLYEVNIIFVIMLILLY